MAKRKYNKSQKVRDYLALHPDEPPRKVAQALRRYGVTAAYVSNIKTKLKKEQQQRAEEISRRARPRKAEAMDPRLWPAAAPITSPVGSIDINQLVSAVQFIRCCGGPEEAMQAIHRAEPVWTALSQ